MKETLVLLPGLLCDAALWQHQIKALEGDLQILVPELTHHDSVPELATHVLAKVNGRFALAGLSMGGYVAMEIMRRAPERVTRLALIDTTARADSEESRQRRKGLIELSRKGDFKGVTPRLLPLLIANGRLGDEMLTREIVAMAGRVGMEAFIRQQTAIPGRIDSRPSLAAIAVPTIVVCGDEDALTPPEHAHEMGALIKGAETHIIKGSGHLPPLEQPDAMMRILMRWVE